MPATTVAAPFGRLLTAMVTPFTDCGELALDGAQTLASALVDAAACSARRREAAS